MKPEQVFDFQRTPGLNITKHPSDLQIFAINLYSKRQKLTLSLHFFLNGSWPILGDYENVATRRRFLRRWRTTRIV